MNCFTGHNWGFPRRWKAFEGERDIDVQRCLSCGRYRKSSVQFGPVQSVVVVSEESRAACAKEREA